MKKIILSIVMLVFLFGCSSLESKPKKEVIQKKEEQDYVDPYLDDNPIELGLYVNNRGNRKLVSTYSEEFLLNKDIVSLEVYYTRDSEFTGNQKVFWNNYYKNYEDIDDYKIGYYVSFKVGDELIEKVILKPSDGNSIYSYIQIYLYDDINQGDGIYSHITDEEMNDNSILTSIKLTGSTRTSEIADNIIVKAFTYDGEDDFDEEGMYRGKSVYEVIINKKG